MCHGGDVVCVCTEFHSNMCYQELMRAEGPKEHPTARYALGRTRVLHTTLFGKPPHSKCRRCIMLSIA